MSKVFGVGVDLVYEKEIAHWLDWSEERLKKTLHSKELEDLRSSKWSAEKLASRIAAKEAFYKASGISFKPNDLGVLSNPKGKPFFCFSEKIKSKMKNKKSHLSISHSLGCLIAFVVIEND